MENSQNLKKINLLKRLFSWHIGCACVFNCLLTIAAKIITFSNSVTTGWRTGRMNYRVASILKKIREDENKINTHTITAISVFQKWSCSSCNLEIKMEIFILILNDTVVQNCRDRNTKCLLIQLKKMYKYCPPLLFLKAKLFYN